eukprot:4575034-Amphidinium_carterae.1
MKQPAWRSLDVGFGEPAHDSSEVLWPWRTLDTTVLAQEHPRSQTLRLHGCAERQTSTLTPVQGLKSRQAK